MTHFRRLLVEAVIATKEEIAERLLAETQELREAIRRGDNTRQKVVILAETGEPVIVRAGDWVGLSDGREGRVHRFIGGDAMLMEDWHKEERASKIVWVQKDGRA